MQNLGGLIIPLGFLAIFYFLVIRPQQKRESKTREMRNNLKVGDEIVTIGGIYGTILKIKDDTLTIEIGADKTKLTIARWAIGSVTNEIKSK
ncbi:preprotein translocase subunit YajC [Clostridium formicaceticum]|uniref:Preprotein translocase subunit YajC n=1 Tax=Clostridium formicaceticum TaxID=1497 RepID=A0AAC9RLB1_9CLOT|nr:preprotein translocase subunit YajC [Clostridium formicaceticum]AOY76942.1 preprotein translocase subunit YajC [Clostridium formicaceticum]ARE87423.1 preprotein translocase subunit YajC [Clostridium formicaceticum]